MLYNSFTLQPVPGITWVNTVDETTPYQTCFKDKCWNVSRQKINILVRLREYYIQQQHKSLS